MRIKMQAPFLTLGHLSTFFMFEQCYITLFIDFDVIIFREKTLTIPAASSNQSMRHTCFFAFLQNTRMQKLSG